MSAPTNWILPRDPLAEKEALRFAQAIWDSETRIEYGVGHSVTAEVRTPLTHGTELQVLVRGQSSAEAAQRLVRMLRNYVVFPPGE